MPLHQAPSTEVGPDGFKHLLAKLIFLQQVAESQDRRFISDPITD